jgi:Domain of unknown function (DUF2017)
MADLSRPRVERIRRGGFRLRLSGAERALLRSIPDELRALLQTDDPALRRLHPPAYPDDPGREAEYRGLVRDELTRQRLQALAVLEETVDRDRLDEDQLLAWLGALNDLRLVLGTRLDVTEEMYEEGMPESDPRFSSFAVYQYLGWLEEQVVEALAAEIDAEGTEA